MAFQKGHAPYINNGRPGSGLEFKRNKIKDLLLDQVAKEIGDEVKKAYWARKIADKLFPTEISGKDGTPIKFDVVTYGTGDRLQHTLQLDSGTSSLEGTAESIEIQNDNLAPKSKEDDFGY